MDAWLADHLGTVWFSLVSFMIAMYVVLDGFDLGAGIIRPLVARTDAERRLVLRTIGPVWDGNEVWLLAAGGTLFFAFPAVYAAGFSGFYLPLTILLWLLIIRGISIEFRNHFSHPVWTPFWDGGFVLSSALIAIFYGAALGNVVRGVPLDGTGYFFEALWTDLRPGPEPGILDWYTVAVAVAAFLTLALHGALWVALKTEGPVNHRARRVAAIAWGGVAASTALITVLTLQIQPQVLRNLDRRPWGYLFPALAVGGLTLAGWCVWQGGGKNELKAFLASTAFILGMLLSAVFGIYPYLLPSCKDPAHGLHAETARAADYGLRIGLVWWVIGMSLAALYFFKVYRQFRGKVRLDGEGY